MHLLRMRVHVFVGACVVLCMCCVVSAIALRVVCALAVRVCVSALVVVWGVYIPPQALMNNHIKVRVGSQPHQTITLSDQQKETNSPSRPKRGPKAPQWTKT